MIPQSPLLPYNSTTIALLGGVSPVTAAGYSMLSVPEKHRSRAFTRQLVTNLIGRVLAGVGGAYAGALAHDHAYQGRDSGNAKWVYPLVGGSVASILAGGITSKVVADLDEKTFDLGLEHAPDEIDKVIMKPIKLHQ